MSYKNHICFLALILSCVFVLSGCSVRKAASVKNWQNLKRVEIGQDRSTVLNRLGEPIKSANAAEMSDIFELNRGNVYYAFTRAGAHSFLDIGTVGLWELIATPLEDWFENPERITIEYDEEYKVKNIVRHWQE